VCANRERCLIPPVLHTFARPLQFRHHIERRYLSARLPKPTREDLLRLLIKEPG